MTYSNYKESVSVKSNLIYSAFISNTFGFS